MDVLDEPHLIIDRHYRDENCILTYRFFKFVQIDMSIWS